MLDALRAVVGADGVLDPTTAARFAVHGQAPSAVAAPRSADEAAEVMKLAAREGWVIVCAGAGTRLDRGNVGRKADVVVTTTRMSAITDYEPADLVITAQAGVSLTQVAGAAARHRQFIALDPPVDTAATLGSVAATAIAGPLRFAHGTPRDHVLGMTVVAADARVLHFGGKVVKNVAGYDVVRPLVGSRGTLALITELSVRLKPMPEVDQTAWFAVDTFSGAAAIAETIIGAQLDVVALEILSPPTSAALGTERWSVLARVHGNRDSVSDAIDRLAAIAADMRMSDTAVWRMLAAQEATAKWNVRIAQLPSRLADSAAAAQRLAEQGVIGEARILMHAGDGIVRILADDASSSFERLVEEERAAVEAHGGTLIIERAGRRIQLDAHGQFAAPDLMAGIKRVFDPVGILAPGSFVV